MARHDAVIIGGGPAGAAAAIYLARGGVKVLLLEKQAAAHHKVCGEFIGPDAARSLALLGLDLAMLGAEKISHCRLICGNDTAQARLPLEGLSLSRFALDESLLLRAREAKAEVRRDCTVKSIAAASSGWNIGCADGSVIYAPTLFLATGKHNLKGCHRSLDSPDMIAFKMHYRLEPQQARQLMSHVELYSFDGGYAGLEPVEDDCANLCLIITKDSYRARGRSWEALPGRISPQLERRLRGAVPCWPRPLAISGIPYGYIYKQSMEEPEGLYRLGDQMAVIPSFSGSGMGIALHTARLAADQYLHGNSDLYYEEATFDLLPQIRKAMFISRMPYKGINLACRLFPGIAIKAYAEMHKGYAVT